MHALRMLGLERHAQIALYKVAMTWPLETEGLRAVRPRQARAAGGGGEAQLRRDRRSATRCTTCRPTSGPRSAARPIPPARRCCRR